MKTHSLLLYHNLKIYLTTTVTQLCQCPTSKPYFPLVIRTETELKESLDPTDILTYIHHFLFFLVPLISPLFPGGFDTSNNSPPKYPLPNLVQLNLDNPLGLSSTTVPKHLMFYNKSEFLLS